MAAPRSAIALLGNTISTGAILVVLILILGPISGAHLNPVVTLAFALRGAIPWTSVGAFIASQVVGAVLGVWLAHAMFDLAILQISTTVRTGQGQWIAEATATFGLLVTIFGCLSSAPQAVPFAVGLYITAAYWFTASTSFANPAVSIARAFSDTFAGIAPASVPAFVVFQLVGMVAALLVASRLWTSKGVQS